MSTEQYSTRLAEPFRATLAALRRDISTMTDAPTAAVLLDRVQDLADELIRGTAPLVQVPLSAAELEAARAREGMPLGDFVRTTDSDLEAKRNDAGITALLDDTCGAGNSDRDHRPLELVRRRAG